MKKIKKKKKITHRSIKPPVIYIYILRLEDRSYGFFRAEKNSANFRPYPHCGRMVGTCVSVHDVTGSYPWSNRRDFFSRVTSELQYKPVVNHRTAQLLWKLH